MWNIIGFRRQAQWQSPEISQFAGRHIPGGRIEMHILPTLFLNSPWPGILTWAVLYVSDYALTIFCARTYRRAAAEKIVYEGSFELNPVFQRDIDSLRSFSPRFLLMLLSSCSLFGLLWWLSARTSFESYCFTLGAGVSVQLALHVRHFRNLYLFRAMVGTDVARGRIEYSRPLVLRLSAVEMLAFTGLFGVLSIFTRSWFAAGGTFACLLLAAKHWWLARRCAASKQP
jgi:hypothetical protein